MRNSRLTIYVVPLFLAYAASIVVFVPPHTDVDFVFGSGNAQLTNHGDANNCKHLSLSHREHCILCSNSSGRQFIFVTPNTIELTAAPAIVRYSCAVAPPALQLSFSLSRRGPPPVLTTA